MRFRSKRTPTGRRALTTATLAFAMYCGVSGGPFGLEPLVGAAGPLWAIVLILVLPIVWALPDALTTAELASAIPEEGGYTVWVERAIGPFAAFLDAWWTWLYSLVDCAVYPALFIQYADASFKLAGWHIAVDKPLVQAFIVVAVVGGVAWLNARGARPVGLSSAVFTALIVLPFALMCGVGMVKLVGGGGHFEGLFHSDSPGLWVAITAGLPVAMWNYQGWDSLSTVAGEVESPGRAYPRALALALAATTLGYLLPVAIAVPFVHDSAQWTDRSWPAIAAAVSGPALGPTVAFAALISQLAQLNSMILSSTRIPYALARERYLPRFLADVDPCSGTPRKTLWLSAVVIAGLTYWSLRDLLTLNVILFSSALVLEGISLVVLRKKAPHMPRPFRIPGGYPVAVLVAALPVCLSGILVVSQIQDKGWIGQLPTAIALLSGPLLFAASSMVRARRTSP
ncbi:MAG: APC family permease [Fimbriimonadaceae bacterium]